MKQPLVIFGAGEFAQIACEYFTHDSEYRVEAFVVSREYFRQARLAELPVIVDEELEENFPPGQVNVFVAIPATALNQHRARIYAAMKLRGYHLASYVSSRAFVWHNVSIGDNCFIFENNVLQPFVTIGSNCVLWSGNHIGHRTCIRDHVFLASHAVVSGYCEIGEYSFLGVNCTLTDRVVLAPQTFVGAGAMVSKNTEANRIYIGNPARVVPGRLATETEL